MKRLLAKIKYYARLTYFVYVDERTNLLAKTFAFLTVSYAFSPIDLIPDFIPVVGLLDDVLILPLLLILTLALVSKEVKKDARSNAADFSVKIEKKWYYSVLIISLWVFFLVFVLLRVEVF